MALDQGLGGGVVYTGPSLIVPWWDEEERKRKQELGIAGAPMPSGQSVTEMSRGDFVSAVEQGQQASGQRFTSTRTGERMDSFEELWSLQRQVGEDALAKRIADVTSIWQAHLPTLNGRDSIWDLVVSPYSLDYIEEMCRQAGNAAYTAPWDVVGNGLRELQDKAVEKEVKQNQYNPNDPYGKLAVMAQRVPGYAQPGESLIEKIGEKLISSRFTARNEDGSINWGWSGVAGDVAKFWEHPNEVAGAAAIVLTGGASSLATGGAMLGAEAATTQTATLLARLGGSRLLQTGASLKGAGEVVGALDQAVGTEQGAQSAAQQAAERGLTGAQSYVINQYAAMSSYLYRADESTAMAVQQTMQEGKKDKYGNILPGTQFGTELQATGAWTEEWDAALRQAVSAEVSENIQKQREWIEAGYAESYFTVDGNMDTEQWRKAEVAAEEDELYRARRKEEDPVAYAREQMQGIPRTMGQVQALVNRLKAEGIGQAPLKAMITTIGFFGGTYNSVLASAEYTVRRDNDPVYQQLRSELNEYAKSTGKYTENELAVLGGRYSFMDDELASGRLAGDKEAQRLAAKIKQRTAQLVASGFSPSSIGLAGHILKLPYEQVEEFKEENADLDLGLNLIRDVVLAVGTGPMVRQLKRGKTIGASVEAFKGSDAAFLRAQEVNKYIRENKPGQVESVIKGGDAPAIARTLQEAYNGKNSSGGFWRNIAHDIRQDIESGDMVAAAEKLERGGVSATEASAAAAKAQAVYNPAKTKAQNITRIAGELAKEQKTSKTLLDLDRTTMDHLAAGYASGMSIFPYFRNAAATGGGLYPMAQRSWHNMVAGIKNPALKTFLERNTLKLNTRAPVERQEYLAQEAGSRIFEAAYAASDGNINFALRMRDRWVMSRSQKQMDVVAEQISMEANKNFSLPKKKGGENGVELSVNPSRGESSRALADTGQAAYKAMFKDARSSIWAPHNLDALTGADKIFTQYVRNPYRKFGQVAKKINDPLRRWTVGFPLLFTKHAITDSTRSLIEGGAKGFFDAFNKSKSFEASLAELSPEVANSVRANLHKSKMSEQHYNIGHDGTTQSFKVQKIYEYDAAGNLVKTNMAEGVEALRRIAIGKVFERYADGGLQSVADWLFTKEGRQFMYKSGNMKLTKDFLTQIGANATGPHLYQTVVADYLQRFGMGYLEALDITAPQIAAGLKEMALNKTPLTQKNIKALVERVNAGGVTENPFLSIADEPSLNFAQKYIYSKQTSAAANRTAAFMTPNKWNRETLYKASFDKFYKDMKKQGFDADTSGKIAMDLAEMETARVHFDLANGLMFETQNRWFAWFGTKHRLYNTYLVKMATERPSIAGAAQTLMDYLEDKNSEDPNASEWDKQTIFFDLPNWFPGVKDGDRWGLNPATIVWLAEYPIESTSANLVKIGGATAINTALGDNTITQGFGDFGFSTGRWDGIVTTMAAAVSSYAAMRTATDEQKQDSKWLVDFFNNTPFLTERVRKRISKGMSLAEFEAIGRGETLTPEQAFKSSMLSSLMYEYMQLAKPLSGRLYTANEGQANQIMKEFDKVPVEDRAEWLNAHPQASALFGMYSTNPAEKMIIDRGWNILNKAKVRKAQEYEQALADGTIFDPTVTKAIEGRWNTAIERLTDPDWLDENGEPADEYNAAFAKVWKSSGYEEFSREQGIKILFPWVDSKAANFSGNIPSQQQQVDEAARLGGLYDRRRGELGWEGLADASPALFWLKNDMVTEPMRKYTKNVAEGDYPWASRSQENIASTLARGEAGPMRSTAYLNEVHLRDQMAAYAAGTDSRAKRGVTMSTPMFSKMTTEDKADIGWNSDKSAEYLWRRWAMQKAIQQVWMKQNGVSPSSTKAKEMASALDQWAEDQGQGNKYFKTEYEFAQKPLHERLQDLGVGTTGKESDQGWQEFFALVESYQSDLASADKKGLSPQAQKAAPITQAYLEQILVLKDRYDKWWQEFSQMYTPSKFGFYWRLGDGRDKVLFGVEEQAEYDEAYDYEVF